MTERRLTPPGDKIKRLAHRLIGTIGIECIDELSDLERWECRQLDVLAFACTGCGWWFAATERGAESEDGWFCKECEREGRR
jgi:hypothetical protein